MQEQEYNSKHIGPALPDYTVSHNNSSVYVCQHTLVKVLDGTVILINTQSFIDVLGICQ